MEEILDPFLQYDEDGYPISLEDIRDENGESVHEDEDELFEDLFS